VEFVGKASHGSVIPEVYKIPVRIEGIVFPWLREIMCSIAEDSLSEPN